MTNQKKKPLNQLLKLSNLGIQMGLIIGIGVFTGLKTDLYFKFEDTFTIVFSLIELTKYSKSRKLMSSNVFIFVLTILCNTIQFFF